MASGISHPCSDVSNFWGEIAPSEHIAQFYEDDAGLIDTLTGFVGGGLKAGDSTIVIATPRHLRSLEQSLASTDVDLVSAILEDRYIALDAEATLASFMVEGWPDEERFSRLLSQLLVRAMVKNRKVRAFGEMVALLWARGEIAATVQLERMWQRACQSRTLPLLCAYPKTECIRAFKASLDEICAAHSRVI
jgi:hypothetical protein